MSITFANTVSPVGEWLPEGEKRLTIMFIRFHTIQERDGRIDGQTDRQTPRNSVSYSTLNVAARDLR